MKRAFIIAANTLKESLRQKLILLLALVAVVLVASSNYFLKLDLGHEKLKFVFDFTSGALGFFGSIIAIVFGKSGGAFAVLALFCTVVALCGCAMIALADSQTAHSGNSAPLSPNYFGIAVFAAIQWLKLCTVAALSALICSVSTSLLFSVEVSFGAVAICSMGEIGNSLGAPETAMSDIAAIIFPNLRVFNASEAFAFAPVDAAAAAAAAGYAAIYIVLCLSLAAWAFSKREF